MSDNRDNFTQGAGSLAGARYKTPCRVAYTLNNSQPVACTIIGNQPMFYMDYEEDRDEGTFLDAHEIAALEKEVSRLKKEIELYDDFADFLNTDEDKKFQLLLENSSSFSEKKSDLAFGNRNNNNDFSHQSYLRDIEMALSHSRVAKSYMDHAKAHNVRFLVSSQIETAFYDRKGGVILVNPHLDIHDAILLSARELRRHWQHRQGALINPLVFQPDNAILVNRLQCADLITSTVRVAWELQLSGQREVWERLENSSMADLARAFAHEAFLDFRTINNGIANAAVLEAWFLSDRAKTQDKHLIQQMLMDTQGYVFDNNDSMRSVSAELICALGTMPFGKNYLAQHTMTILDDPIFNDVRDRSNANFLWFIKFERSFRETEHELQNGESSKTSSKGSSSNNTGSNHAKPQRAAIIPFEPKQNNAGPISEQGLLTGESVAGQSDQSNGISKPSDGEKIIYLQQRWSGE